MTTPEEQRVIDAAKAWKKWVEPDSLPSHSVLNELYKAIEALPDEDVELVARAIADERGGLHVDWRDEAEVDWRDEAKAVVKALRDAGRLK